MRAATAVLAGALAALAAACGSDSGGTVAGRVTGPPPLVASTRDGRLHHYEYVFPDRTMLVYDIDHGQRLVERRALPAAHGIRGVAASPSTHRLYVSFGSDAGDHARGSLLAYDLLTGRVVWTRTYPFGIDSMDITPDGRRIYMPVGEASQDTTWNVLDAGTGAPVGRIHAGRGPHNTIVGLDGRRVYLGGRNTNELFVASTATDRVVLRVGPLISGVRPFTIDGRQRFAFTTATGFRGFQVSSLQMGRVLFTVAFAANARLSGDPPSHGISLSPDERELWVVDHPADLVRVFDVSGLPRRRPRQVAVVRLQPGFAGSESPCGYDCGRSGWLQHSLDGRFVYVGDAGEVISTRTRRAVAVLPGLRNSRKFIEIDWRGGRPVATSGRAGVGRVGR